VTGRVDEDVAATGVSLLDEAEADRAITGLTVPDGISSRANAT
jgi:hypothetical protein